MSSPAVVTELRKRITHMQSQRIDDRALPTATSVAPLLPGGALRRGCSYSVSQNMRLGFELLSAATQAGMWCAFIGTPHAGFEAAQDAGIPLSRLISVSAPAAHFAHTIAQLTESIPLLLVGSPVDASGQHSAASVSDAQAQRIAARLREHGACIVSLGSWPGASATLSVTSSQWYGLENGFGLLTSNELTVASRFQGRSLSRTVRLPSLPSQVEYHRFGQHSPAHVRSQQVLVGS